MVAVGCDGTNTNTGNRGGVIRLMEVEIGRALQWLVCLLHTNELPLRHLLQNLDGVTHFPTSFSGPIGKAIQACESMPVVQCSPITLENFPSVDNTDLSSDQKYLFDMCQVIAAGVCQEDIALRKPGPVVHSRWLTTASRILRLYISSVNPSEQLVTLTTFIIPFAPKFP